jgi:predicted MPP superfamily phosphohydrolase
MIMNAETSYTTTRRPRPIWARYARRTAVVSILYFGMLVYPVLRTLGLVVPDWQPGVAALLVILVGPIACRVVYERFPGSFTRALAAFGLTYLGLAFQLFPLVLVFEIANLVTTVPHVAAGWTLIGAITVIGLAGFINTQILHVKQVDIEASEATDGQQVVQISDIHIGSRSPRLLTPIVERVNALHPDYVLITGDLVDYAGISRQALSVLGEITAPTYFAIGNHERYVDLNAIDERLRALGIHVLRNEAMCAGPFQFIGVDDVDQAPRIAEQLAPIELSDEHYQVLLYHRPDGFDAAVARNIPLMLAGHTHAGQIPPFNFLVKRVYPRLKGLFREADSQLYVSPGTGTWGPVLRLVSRSEITLLNFKGKP